MSDIYGTNITINQLATIPSALATTTQFAVQTTVAAAVTYQASATAVGALVFGVQTTATTVGAAGVSPALPSTPLGYMAVTVGGVAVKIPFYTA